MAVYAVVHGGGPAPLALLAAAAGLALVLVALLAVWDDGLVAGPALLLFSYTLSLADSGAALDWAAPLVGAGLVAVVEFGSWSLELRDGAEEGSLRRLPAIVLLLAASTAAGAVVLAMGTMHPAGGPALWAVGALTAIGILVLIGRPLGSRDAG
ncbi:MAG TPA: hypothetical protein VFG93_04460 [Gaiellaceae bacterium]|nr:hypothetical protein [Gaiellaceae bacterium]